MSAENIKRIKSQYQSICASLITNTIIGLYLEQMILASEIPLDVDFALAVNVTSVEMIGSVVDHCYIEVYDLFHPRIHTWFLLPENL